MTARVSMLLKSCTSPNMLPFSLCNKKKLAIRHMNRPLFPTTLSIPSYDIGQQVGLRTYQHLLVKQFFSRILFISSCTILNIHIIFLLPNKKYIFFLANFEPLLRVFKIAFITLLLTLFDTHTRMCRQKNNSI